MTNQQILSQYQIWLKNPCLEDWVEGEVYYNDILKNFIKFLWLKNYLTHDKISITEYKQYCQTNRKVECYNVFLEYLKAMNFLNSNIIPQQSISKSKFQFIYGNSSTNSR